MYIDPNFGGMLFQVFAVIFGVISGVVLLFAGRIKMGIAKLRRSLRKKSGDSEPSDHDAGPNRKLKIHICFGIFL